jgi:hypothetical protein
MIKQFSAFFEAFKAGKELTNAATWKNRQIAAGALTGLLGAAVVIAKGFGYDIDVDQATVEALAGGITALYAVFNVVLVATTSAKVGLPAGSADRNGPGLDSPTPGN